MNTQNTFIHLVRTILPTVLYMRDHRLFIDPKLDLNAKENKWVTGYALHMTDDSPITPCGWILDHGFKLSHTSCDPVFAANDERSRKNGQNWLNLVATTDLRAVADGIEEISLSCIKAYVDYHTQGTPVSELLKFIESQRSKGKVYDEQ